MLLPAVTTWNDRRYNQERHNPLAKERSMKISRKACIASGLLMAAAVAATGYHVIEKIHIGGQSGWDYLTMDSAARRLYVSNGTRVVVMDPDDQKILGEIPKLMGVHGIALAPDLHRGFISNGRANNVVIFDTQTLKPVGEVKTGVNPDSIVFEPVTGRVFTFNGRSHDSTAFDAKTGTVAGTFPMGGKPEFSVADGRGKIYVNVEDTSEIAEVDAQKMAVIKRAPLKPCEYPSGLAMDTRHRRLFSACDNKLMAVTDADTLKVIATPAIGERPDGAGFDPGEEAAFSSNGEGTLTVVKDVHGKYEALETVPTERGARTMTVDTKTHRLYLPTAEFGSTPPPTAQHPRTRPPIVPDTFHIVVVGK
jgi:DNA-binding beta-propeller fold protein YncE